MLNNIKAMQKNRGFTIVELLIVIVVIGILAAITIVAYGNITAQANTNSARANATNVAKVAEAYNADEANSGYPTQAQIVAYSGISRLPTGVTVSATNPANTDATTRARIGYAAVGTTGACISYWNYQTSALQWVYAGNGRTGSGAAGAAAACSST